MQHRTAIQMSSQVLNLPIGIAAITTAPLRLLEDSVACIPKGRVQLLNTPVQAQV